MAEMKTDPSFQFKKPIIPCTSNISFRPIDLLCNQRFGDMCFNLSPKTCMKGIVTWGYAYNILQQWTTNVNHHQKWWYFASVDPILATRFAAWWCTQAEACASEHKKLQASRIEPLTPPILTICRPKHLKLACRSFASVSTCLSRRPGNWPHEFLSLVGSDQNWKMNRLNHRILFGDMSRIGWTIHLSMWYLYSSPWNRKRSSDHGLSIPTSQCFQNL